MFGKWFAAGMLTAAGVLVGTLPVRAGDTYRLSIPGRAAATPTLNLVDDGKSADTVDVRRGGGFRGGYGGYRGFRGGYGYLGGYYGGFRGGYGGYRGGYGYGGYPRYYGGYRGFYGYGGYPSYYGGYSCYPSYYGSSYYSPPVYYGGACLYPSAGADAPVMSLSITTAPTVQQPVIQSSSPLRQPGIEFVPPPTSGPVLVQPNDPTFPYDGGPRNPAPMPKADPTPDLKPSATLQEGRSVSLPARTPEKLVYPAYGEQRTPSVAPRLQDRAILVKGDPAQKAAK